MNGKFQPQFIDFDHKIQLESTQLTYTNKGELLKKYHKHNGKDLLPKAIYAPGTSIKEELKEVWIILLYRGFYVLVEQNIKGSSFGPHVAKLMYNSHQTHEKTWIATQQIEGFFHSTPVIDHDKWFQSTASKSHPVVE